ncbi:restriction endonuclease subunit S [Schaalia odontolytica]|uniref:restriction endonuclease subunit S n=1 Tax=Schaalia odontolytica TaxID=1660 RepID=UPI001D09519A|nr:restriction endonuclease subunit S [Schaalia odontolytica]MCB6401443.1 restriction endonuclease subunit S [Schaalia odontolytica]
MTKAPFWTVAELVAQTAAPSGFQVSLEDIVPGVGTLVLGRLSRYSADGTPFERGDVLFGKLRPYLAKYWLADREGVAGGDIHVYRPRKGVDPRYLAYIVGSRDFMRYAVAASKGVKMPRVEWMSLRQYGVNWYDEDTQRRVADYLDRETGEIDAMLAKLDELREQLIQRRLAAVDNEFSCVGTSSKARLPFVADVIPGLTYSPSDIVDSGGVVVHRAGSVQNSRIDRSDLVRVSTSIPAKLCIQPGDILVCTRNGSAHLVGKCAIVGISEIGETWGAFMTVLRSQHYRYIYWYMQSSLFAQERKQYFTSTINQLTVGMFSRMMIPFPESHVQERIADHLDEVTGRIDAMLATIDELKALLVERRAALITDVVTGRKKVPA